MMVDMVSVFGKPGVSIIFNGGQIAREEAMLQLHRGNPVITVRGSGRAADELLDPASDLFRRIPRHANLQVVDMGNGEALYKILESAFQFAP